MPADDPTPEGKIARGRGACVAVDRAAAEAGAAILRDGGNAFDAAVAAGFVEAVASPHNCGIGGYGAAGMAFRAKDGRLVAIEADAVAPMAATPGMFPIVPGRDPNGLKPADASQRLGPRAVAVPGVLAGLLALLELGGTWPRARVMAPAIALARAGVTLTAGQAKTWYLMRADAEGTRPRKFAGPVNVPMPLLAEALEAIADDGAAVFYSGRIGRAIADHVRRLGGPLTRDDLAAYQARVVEPSTVALRGQTVATTPPPAGGLTSLQIASLLDRLARDGEAGAPGSARRFEASLEALKVAWSERLTTLADPAAMPKPPAEFLADGHLDALLARVRDGLRDPKPGRIVAPDPLRGTVHLAAADGAGNLVAWTQTHGGGFGAQVMVPGTEIVLGHGMCRFDPRPGWPNSVGPGKRPLHNMCPTLVVKDGRAVLAAGASGGRTIVNNVASLLVACLVDGLGPAEALAAPRLQCETIEPATVEAAAGPEVLAALGRRHAITPANRDAGNAQLIALGPDGRWTAAAEPRHPTAQAIALA